MIDGKYDDQRIGAARRSFCEETNRSMFQTALNLFVGIQIQLTVVVDFTLRHVIVHASRKITEMTDDRSKCSHLIDLDTHGTYLISND
jgi:hypothetical protein